MAAFIEMSSRSDGSMARPLSAAWSAPVMSMSRSASPARTKYGGRQVGVHLQRLAHLALRGVEVHGVLQLDPGHGEVGERVAGGELERLLDHLAGVAGVVLVEEELRAIEQRLHPLPAPGLLRLAVDVVGVVVPAEQVRGAGDQGEPHRVAGGHPVGLVVVQQRHQRGARVAPPARADEQLAQLQPRAAGAVVGLDLLERGERLRGLALRRERLAPDGRRLVAGLRAQGRGRLRRGDGHVVAPREDLEVRLPEQRLRVVLAALDRGQLLLRERVVAAADGGRGAAQGLVLGGLRGGRRRSPHRDLRRDERGEGRERGREERGDRGAGRVFAHGGEARRITDVGAARQGVPGGGYGALPPSFLKRCSGPGGA